MAGQNQRTNRGKPRPWRCVEVEKMQINGTFQEDHKPKKKNRADKRKNRKNSKIKPGDVRDITSGDRYGGEEIRGKGNRESRGGNKGRKYPLGEKN